MSTKINVTQQDINVGKSLRNVGKRASTCPVALAMRRDWHGDAVVGGTTYGRLVRDVVVPKGVDDILGVNRKYLPLKVQRWIHAFDRALVIKPMSFWVS